MLLIGIAVLAALYLVACHARWLVARHFGQGWRLMGPAGLEEAWDHMRFSGRCAWWRMLVAAWAAVGLALVVAGMAWR